MVFVELGCLAVAAPITWIDVEDGGGERGVGQGPHHLHTQPLQLIPCAHSPYSCSKCFLSHVLAVGSPLVCASQLLPQRVSCYMNVPSPPSCYSSSLLHHHSQAAAKKHARFCLITQQQLHAHVTAAVCSCNSCRLLT